MSVYPRLSKNNEILSWHINDEGSDTAANNLLMLINLGVIRPTKYHRATITFDNTKPIPTRVGGDDKLYLLKFFSNKGAVPITVHKMSVGKDDDPDTINTLKCLEYMDFVLSGEETKKVCTRSYSVGKPDSLPSFCFIKKNQPDDDDDT